MTGAELINKRTQDAIALESKIFELIKQELPDGCSATAVKMALVAILEKINRALP